MNNKELIQEALNYGIINRMGKHVRVGVVAAALESYSGNTYTGVSIEAPCGMGFCAEHAAIAELLKNGESKIRKIVAIDSKSKRIMTPCGRCRELMRQIDDLNLDLTDVIISEEKAIKLKELLPLPFVGPL